MGVLCNLSMPCRGNVDHDGFSTIDDRPQKLFSTRYRSPSYSETASSSYLTCLLNICRVGHVHNMTSQQSLPGTGDQIKTNEANEKGKDARNNLLALSASRIVRARSVSYDDIFWDSDIVPKGSIHQSRLNSAPLEDAAAVDSKPRLRSKSLGDKPKAVERKPLIDTVKELQAAKSPQGQQRTSSISKRNDYAPDSLLPSSRFPKRLVDRSKWRQHSAATTAKKRERENSDDDITQIPIEHKKARRRTLKITVSVKAHEAKVKFSASPAKPGDQPSLFDVARKVYQTA